MGLPPTGEIVARPMVARACGCLQEFQHYKVDKYRAQRLAKFQRTRCPACVAKLAEEQQKALPIPKGDAVKLLPHGAQLSLARQPDGAWAGTLEVGSAKFEATGEATAGPQSVLGTLAQLWATATQKPST